MIGSTGRRWKHICIAGAGLACLGAGTIFISGCSTTTVSDTRTPAKADQQVAGTKGTAPGKPATARKAKTTKTAPQVAKKNVPGKVRISDLDGETRVQMAARVSQNKAQADASRNNAAAAPSGASTAAVANKPTQAPARSADQRQVARAPGAANAAQPQRAAAASSTPPAVAAKTRTATGEIKQTSGDGQPRSGSSSRSVTTTSAARPVITPRKSEWQPENGGEAVASNHERRRADRLMQRAYTMYEGGYREEALRLASVAAELEYSQLAVYKRGEERPSDFIEFLLTASGKKTWSKAIETAPLTSDRQPDPSGTSRSKEAALAADATTDRTCSQSARNSGNDVRPAEATSLPQAPRDLKPTTSNAPRFTTGEKNNLQAAANAGQIEIPVAKAQRKAEVSVVTADGNSSSVDLSPKAVDSRAVVTADRVEESDERPIAPKVLVAKTPAPAPVAAAPEPETEPLTEVDAPAAAPSHSPSQLTLASLVGLLAGIAGMLGLGWWRRQERRHYAGGK